jgi:hypothetical protein
MSRTGAWEVIFKTLHEYETEYARWICALKDNGWKEYSDPFLIHSRNFYRHFATKHKCALNDDPRGISVGLHVYRSLTHNALSFELDLSAELVRREWVKLSLWGSDGPIEVAFTDALRLVKSWESIAKLNR